MKHLTCHIFGHRWEDQGRYVHSICISGFEGEARIFSKAICRRCGATKAYEWERDSVTVTR